MFNFETPQKPANEITEKSPIDEVEAEKILKTETNINRGVLQKIADNEKLRKAFKILAVAVGLFMGAETAAQSREPNTKKDTIENYQKTVETEQLLQDHEHVVPDAVMRAFADVTDPHRLSDPAGGFFSRDWLQDSEKIDAFTSSLKRLGYQADQIQTFVENFKTGNIVFSESALQLENFKSILGHERLHKEIYLLPEEQKEILNEARDDILEDYKDKEYKWSEELDDLYKKQLPAPEYSEQSRRIIQSHEPILLDANEEVSDLMPIIRNANEFYTYLYMNKLSPRVLKYLQAEHPDAFEIYQQMQQQIDGQLNSFEK